jgi:hypothetical protein
MKRNKYKQPDAEKHLKISLIKSALRVIAGAALICNLTIISGLFIIISEALGVAEELV